MKTKKCDSCLEKLKQDYVKLKSKYRLPEFDKLNRDFEVEKVSERETDYLLRELRKVIAEKEIAVLRFLEMLLNPSNAPFFIFTVIKNLSASDKKVIEKIYSAICEFEISAVALDLIYDEKKEAEFIKNAVKKWDSMQDDLEEFSDLIYRAYKASGEKSKKDYFG
ncbi:hypothetical protein HZA33_05520 [Candidatus Pacearchaeota archaeon]|nr:hypothetical protein [Candidatus Pacearchaeota archaeon]